MTSVFDSFYDLIKLGMIGGGILLFVANCTLWDIRRELRSIESKIPAVNTDGESQ